MYFWSCIYSILNLVSASVCRCCSCVLNLVYTLLRHCAFAQLALVVTQQLLFSKILEVVSGPEFAKGPQQVDLWVRRRGKPFPHIHTYILEDQAGPWCTQLQILDLPVLELNPLNFDFFF
jgi:hypothetical protein